MNLFARPLIIFILLLPLLLWIRPPMDLFACLRSILILSVDPSTHADCNDTTPHIFTSIDLPAYVCIIIIIFLSIRPLVKTLLSKHTGARHDTLPSASSAAFSACTSYDVFINYRVPDLKYALAFPLYHSLRSLGLRVFLDQTEMVVGRNIPDQIEAATSVASVHIALLSTNYAESAFCLDELVLMVKSRAIIIPVFYDVDPCQLVGAYKKALFAHQEKQECERKRIQGWRDGLARVAKISGLERKAFKGEPELVHKIVQDVVKYFPNLHTGVREIADSVHHS